MKRAALTAAMLLQWAATQAAPPAPAVSGAADAPDGRRLYTQRCLMCHGRVGMGTGLLARRMKPEVAELEQRDDLTVAFLSAAARSGIGNMPMITRGDVSDAELAAIAGYLAKGKP